MDKKELLDKFCVIFTEATTSGDSDDIKVSLCMFKKAFDLLADTSAKDAKELVECYEGTLKYYNFLTESETEKILANFVNQDGSRGPKWKDPEDFFKKVDEMGGKIECEPHYNKWALYVTMNKFYSDQNSVIMKWVGDDKDKYFEACYELAVTQLKDKDRPYWVRWYFGVGEL